MGRGGEGAIVGLLVGRQFEAYCSLSSACSPSSLVDLGSSPGCLLVAGLGTTAPYCCWLAGVAPGSVRVLVVNIGCQNRLLAIHASLLLSLPAQCPATSHHHEQLSRHFGRHGYLEI